MADSAPSDPASPEGGPDSSLSAAQRRWVARRLLDWFSHHRRDLPWRRDRDPYRIWLSEVMLQQTTVATVVPYFERFLGAFPTVRHLAAADEQDVLRLWEGLGYYRRARNLHAAARLVVERHSGRFPDNPDELAQLPGLGRYTVNAVLSQAFDLRLPILEANSQRVLARFLGSRGDVSRGPERRRLWEAAELLVPARRAGDFNQALMELGSLVCTPTTPDCANCPLRERCAARRQGLQEEIPARPARRAPTLVQESAVVLRRGTEVLLLQRPTSAERWANLWEFPHGPLAEGETHDRAAQRLAGELTGLPVTLGQELCTIRHAVTRFRITLVCFEAFAPSGEFRSEFYSRGLWLNPAELGSYPVSSPQRKLARCLASPSQQRRLF